MQRTVELAVAASVGAVADCLAGGGGDRRRAGEPRERSFRSDPAAVGPGEDELSGGVRTDAGLVEQLRCEPAGDRFDLAGELTLLGGQLQHPSGDRAQPEQAAARRRVGRRSGCCETLQKPCTCQRPQLAPQRLRCRDQPVAQLAEPGPFGVDCPFACGHKCLQRLTFTPCPRRRRPLLRKHVAGGADRVKRVGLAAGATPPPQPADLVHPLATSAKEAREAGTEGAGALNRERSPTRHVLIDKLERMRVTAAARGDTRLQHDRSAGDVHHRERTQAAVRVDADDVVQPICKHPYRPPAQSWGTHPVPVWR